MTLPASSRELTDDEWQLVELARSTIDANTDAAPDQDGMTQDRVSLDRVSLDRVEDYLVERLRVG